jgi:hypothetical protein
MRVPRFGRTPVVLVIAALTACGGDSAVTFTVAVQSGSGQSGNVNTILGGPLMARVTRQDGTPAANVAVTWAVTAGAAVLNPTSSQSDASGLASTAVTLGSIPGAVTVTATVPGGAVATFALTAVGPAVLSRVAGDSQSGPVGSPLPQPLTVALVGTDGQPYAGGIIAWTVTVGSGQANPPTSTTSASGQATTVITLGAAGDATISASTAGVTPVTFAATGIPPCQYVAPYTLGQSVNGTLSTFDCAVNIGGANFYYDYYGLAPASQQSVFIHMSSGAFDTWLDLFSATSGALVGVNDDSIAGVTNSHVEAFLGAGGYVFGASSFDPVTTGAYTVRTGARAATISQCRVIFGAGALVIGETVEPTDCVDTSTGSTFYSDRLVIALDTDDTLDVRMQSGAVNPFLYLFDLFSSTVVAANDDSAVGTTTAFLRYVSPAFSFYFVDLGTSTAGETGAYTVTVGGSVVAAGVPGARGVRQGAGFVPARLPQRAKDGGWRGIAARAQVAAGAGADHPR